MVKIKHLLKFFWLPLQYKKNYLFMIFARERTQNIWRILPPPKMRQTPKKAKSNSCLTTERVAY